MNWYKNFLKLSMPMVETPTSLNYMNIGHEEFNGHIPSHQEEIWFMDRNYKIKRYPATENTTHSEIERPGFNTIAKGRYDPASNKVSLVIRTHEIPEYDPFNTKKVAYIERQIENALDKEFNNPTIMRF